MAIRRLALALTAALAIGSIFVHGQVPGQNVNMVTGKTFPGGDPWLQKQNEPSGAPSTENPCRLLAGANDYRAVNVPGLPADKETGDAWPGWYTSINCGQTWYSTLVPGYPQDQSAIGKASPVYGMSTGADSTVRAGAGGFFAYSFIAFNRGTNVGKVAVARFLDRNTTEAITKPEKAMAYIDTKVWDSGSAGQFIDKPTLYISQGTGTCTINGRTIPASVVHLAWTVFVGNSDDVIRTKVYYARSSNCGASLDGPATKLSEGYAISQSASSAVAPNGAIYVVWRQFSSPKGDLNQILIAKSIDGGKSFTKGAPLPITPFDPVDQGTTSKTFRTNSFPSVAIDQWNRLYVALAVRGFASNTTQSRVVVMSTLDGIVWTMPQAVENNASILPGHQIMPALTSVGGKLNLVWLDFRDDVSGHFDQFVKEIYPIRHTMDVRGAQATPQQNGALNWTTYGILQDAIPQATAPRISKYLTGDYTDPNGDAHLRLLQFNRSNLKLYAGGTRPFIGDYIDVAGLAFLAQQTNGITTWVPNNSTDPLSATTAAQTFYAFWTDNRDATVGSASPEPDSDTAEGATLNYVAPGTAACAAAGPNPPTKTRNANVYMSRITPGLFVAAPANAKPSVNVSGRLQRAFPVLVQNRTAQTRAFRLTIANQPPDAAPTGTTGIATFVQVPFQQPPAPPIPSPLPAPVTTTDVTVPPNSSATRAVYVISSIKYPRIKVNVVEQGVAPGTELTGSTILNPDIENPDIENPDIENPDIENPDIENAEVHNPDIENPDIENPDIENPDIENPDIENPDIENPDIENPDIENPDIENPDIENPDIENPDIENPDIENGALTDYSVDLQNEGNTTTAYQVKASVFGQTSPYLFQLIGSRVYKTPTAIGCELKEAAQNQVLFNITNPNVAPGSLPNPLDPSATNATVLLAPGEHVKITLRAWDKDVLTGSGAPANDGIQPFCPMLSPLCSTVTSAVTITATSLSSNTGSNAPPSDTTSSTGVVPGTLVVTNTNDSGAGSLRDALTQANASNGFSLITFNIPGAGAHTIAPTSALPQLTKPIVIDGTTQPGYAGSPLIELNGTNAGATAGLVLAANGSVVRGLAINRFNGNGITVQSSNNEITSNYIGTNVAGTQGLGNQGNGLQIIDGADNFIGGTANGARNVISSNVGEGVRIDGAPATGNVIRGNYIGTNATGTAALGNTNSGVYIRRAPANSVIANLLSGNTGFAGLAICGNQSFCGGGDVGTAGNDASGNIVKANLIGTNASGSGAIGNQGFGVSMDATSNTVVGGSTAADANIIAFNGPINGSPGVTVFGTGAGNQIRRNSIHSNGSLGIDLGANQVSPNDYANGDNILVNDEDTGPNGFQNFPDLTSATVSGGTTTVQGTLRSTPSTSFVIDFYNNLSCDASGNGEGQTWVGSITQSTDATGNLPFSATIGGLAEGTLMTAVATSAADGTSEFSGCQMIVPQGFGYSQATGHVYEYVKTPGAWTAANSAAPTRSFRGVAGHLVSITSFAENTTVNDLRNGGDMRGWIGLTDQAVEGTFQWVTGEPVTFTNWAPGEPNAAKLCGGGTHSQSW
jgi:Lectin C-type domain